MINLTSTITLPNLTFPECPRWRDGELYVSDVHAHRIIAMKPDGTSRTVYEHDGQPAGLGWTPDGTRPPNGRLLFVSMVDRKLMRLDDDNTAREVADLTPFEDVQINDMVVDHLGRAYIGGFGFDINTGEQFKPANIIFVDTDGTPRVAASDMRFPNGMVITPDGRTLIAAETAGRRLTAFDIQPDGSLTNRRIWAELPSFPDGICLDPEGAIWVAGPVTKDCIRVLEGGEITHKVTSANNHGVYACALNQPLSPSPATAAPTTTNTPTTLYLCTADTTGPQLAQGISTGHLESVTLKR